MARAAVTGAPALPSEPAGPLAGAGDVFSGLVGQVRVVDLLRGAAVAPVHAYLFVGPSGSGRRRAAMAFAAAVVCPHRGCGECDVCGRVVAGLHPDVLVVERTGASVSMAQAREIRRVALRSPNEGARTVLVLTDFHVVQEAGPALLKVIEEPPPSTVFVVLADHVPPDLVTIASRCVRVEFSPLRPSEITAALVARGVAPEAAEAAAAASGGRLDRAALLVEDPGFAARAEIWRSVPFRLDGTGATVHLVASELDELLAGAGVAPLQARQRAELDGLAEQGRRGKAKAPAGATKELTERHKRELRRLRTDELRFGLAALAGAYRDAALAASADRLAVTRAIDVLQATSESLIRNPSEPLMLQALLLRLPPLRRGIAS